VVAAANAQLIYMAMIDLIKKDEIDPEIIPVAGLVLNYPHLSEDCRFRCY
jgi:hypothetical protein